MRRISIAVLPVALALVALGGFSASQATGAFFHCTLEPCTYTLRSDGTGKTAHHVWVVETPDTSVAVSFTCSEMTGVAVVPAKTASTLVVQQISFPGPSCTINGSPNVEIQMNGCKLEYAAGGTFKITGCEKEKQIEFRVPGCTYTVGEQGPFSGVTFHTVGANPSREITLSTAVHGLTVVADNAGGACVVPTGVNLDLTYLTGNLIATGETGGGVMAEAWFE